MLSAKTIPFLVGVILSINFILFWAVPIMGMGLLWKHALRSLILPIYNFLDTNKNVRQFAANYIYTRPEHADYFGTSVVAILNTVVGVMMLYKKWIRDTVGNVFENILGVWFGNVPWNFTTSHIFIHHRLDGGCGDTFYLWDFDRTSLSNFMLYTTRIFGHMTGYSSLKFFHAHGLKINVATIILSNINGQ